jgi:hypothetical protein
MNIFIGVTAPVVGATSLRNLEELIGRFNFYLNFTY